LMDNMREVQSEAVDSLTGRRSTLSYNGVQIPCECSEKSALRVVFVSWKLSRETNMIDWIGLFNFDDDNPLHYLDHKGRGVVGPQEGTVAWSVMRANLPPSVDTIQFGYVDGLTGEVLARSPPIRITNRARLIV
ncbi:hypothetical protein OSTOST_06503, partial [Ostertagia ostertagi]